MFDKAHCTKFQFLNMDEITKQAEKARGKKKPISRKDLKIKEEERIHQFTCHASAEILSRKNELGLILDTISSCLEMDPEKRPTIRGLINSPLFDIDSSERAQQTRFCQNAILYRSPTSSVSMRITAPLRQICADAIVNPMSVYDSEVAI
jgi:serine/threonine protein kinase